MLLMRVCCQVYGVAGFVVSVVGVTGLPESQSMLLFAAGGCLFCTGAIAEILLVRLKPPV